MFPVASTDALRALVAASRGDTALVLSLVKKGHGSTRLVSLAAEQGHTETVLALVKDCGVDAGAPVNGVTPIIAAAGRGHTKTVVALAKECGAEVGSSDDGGKSAIFAAAWGDNTATVVALVKECGADARVTSDDGMTLLQTAAENGHTATVVALVKQCGVNTRVLNETPATVNGHELLGVQEGKIALIRAIACKHMNTIKALINECGVRAVKKPIDDLSPLKIAIEFGCEKTIDCMLNNCQVEFLLQKCRVGDKEMSKGCYYRTIIPPNSEIKATEICEIFKRREARERLRRNLLLEMAMAVSRGCFFGISNDIFSLVGKYLGFWCPEPKPVLRRSARLCAQ